MTTYQKKNKEFYERNKKQRAKYYKKYYQENKDTYAFNQRKLKKVRTLRNGHNLARTKLFFSSQKKLKSYVKDLCLKHLDETIDKEHCLFDLILDMWDRHPTNNKINNIPKFKFVSPKNRSRSFSGRSPFKRTEKFRAYFFNPAKDKWSTFSLLNKCVTGKSTSNRSSISKACRHAIQDQIDYYRQNHGKQCEKCKITGVFMDIDHINPFAEIFEQYETLHGLPKVQKSERHWLFTNPEEKNIWTEFHLRKAKLQTLCQPCHLLKK